MTTEKESGHKIKCPSRGGAREGSGRPKGSSNKVTAQAIQDQIQAQFGKSFEQVLVEQLHNAIIAEDTKLTKDYLQFIANKVVSDKIETDITSNGETISVPVINLIRGPDTL